MPRRNLVEALQRSQRILSAEEVLREPGVGLPGAPLVGCTRQQIVEVVVEVDGVGHIELRMVHRWRLSSAIKALKGNPFDGDKSQQQNRSGAKHIVDENELHSETVSLGGPCFHQRCQLLHLFQNLVYSLLLKQRTELQHLEHPNAAPCNLNKVWR